MLVLMNIINLPCHFFYVVTAIDQYSRVIISELVAVKSMAYVILKHIIYFAKLFKSQVNAIKSDNGGEFIN